MLRLWRLGGLAAFWETVQGVVDKSLEPTRTYVNWAITRQGSLQDLSGGEKLIYTSSRKGKFANALL